MLRLGKLLSRTGTTPIIFGYNGRDGVVTDANGLIYMRARYYSPEMRRFINADIIPGEISNAITLNRFAYANGNPVSNVDPFGLSAERGSAGKDYLFMLGISPWGNPNTHIIHYDKYWLERWYDSNGRAVKDRHWTDHRKPHNHINPHEQEWDWSDPDNPKLPHQNNPVPDGTEPPTSEKEEPWVPKDSEDEQEEKQEDTSTQSFSFGKLVGGVAIVAFSTVAVAWIAVNDVSGVGVLDDVAMVPVIKVFESGMKLILQN